MGNNFNLTKFNKLFKTKRFDIERELSKEFQTFTEEVARKNSFNSGIAIKRRSELKQKHFQELCQLCLDSLIQSCDVDYKISDDDQNQMIKEINNFSNGFTTHEKNGLKSAMLSYGFQEGALIKISQDNLTSLINQVRVNVLDKLLLKINDHNSSVNKRNNLVKTKTLQVDHQSQNKINWLELKPNIFGIGLNFNNIINFFCKKFSIKSRSKKE